MKVMPTVKSRLLARAACLLSAGLLLAQPAGGPAGAARKAVDLLLAGKYPELDGGRKNAAGRERKHQRQQAGGIRNRTESGGCGVIAGPNGTEG